MKDSIQIKNLEKSFGRSKVLQGIDVTMKAGEVTAIMGPNGSGKSTLMKSILGLVIPEKGEIIINGSNVVKNWMYRKDIGYMPQIANYPENISVKELISMILDIRQETTLPTELIHLFNLENALHKKLKELSGGMRQKVNAILALMFETSILIFDEPTVGLDPISRITFKDLIRKEKEKGKTILLITHHINEIEELADKIIFMMDGKIYFGGSVSEIKEQEQEQNLENAAAKILAKNLKYN